MKRFMALTCLFIFTLSSLTGCALFKSDKEKIEDRIESFISAYNSGDLGDALDCLDAKTKNAFKSSMALTEALSGMSGFSISDLFSIGIGISEGDTLTVDIVDIEIEDERAMVDVIVSYKDSAKELKEEKAFFTMVKEKQEWYIKNFENK